MKRSILAAILSVFSLSAFADNLEFTLLKLHDSQDAYNLTPGQEVLVFYSAQRTGSGPGAVLELTLSLDGQDLMYTPLSVGSTWSLPPTGATMPVTVPSTDGIYALEGCLKYQSTSQGDCERINLHVGDTSNVVATPEPTPPPSSGQGSLIESASLYNSVLGTDFRLPQSNTCGSNEYRIAHTSPTYVEDYAMLLVSAATNKPLTVIENYCDGDTALIHPLM